MKYCNKCKVNVAGSRLKCPLCQSELDIKDENESFEKFPIIKKRTDIIDIIWRFFIVISILAIIVSAIVNYQFPSHGAWCRFVAAGVFSAWIFLFIIMRKYKNILKCLFYETIVVAVFVLLWDYYTGMNGWSLNFVLPSLFVLVIISMGIIAKVLKIGAEEHIVYLVSLATFGIIPGVFWLKNMVEFELPSMICIGLSFVLLFSLAVFEGKKMWQEFIKRMHI